MSKYYESGVVDIIIPTYKPDEKFRRLIDRLHKQSVMARNIYVINTEESLLDADFLDVYDDVIVKHIKKAEFDHGGTRNMGASLSDAEFVLFMTQDAVPKGKNLIESLRDAFMDERVGAAFARQVGDKHKDYLEYYTRTFNYPAESRMKTKRDIDELGIKTFFCSNVCAMYRHVAIDQVGGFVLKAIFNEDMMMAASLIDADYGIYYDAEAVVEHWHSYSGVQQFKRNFDVAVSQVMAGGYFTSVSSESEGIKLVTKTMKHLFKHGRAYLIPKLVYSSGCKFLGYRFGKCYKKLPMFIIKKMSLNPKFWDNYGKAE